MHRKSNWFLFFVFFAFVPLILSSEGAENAHGFFTVKNISERWYLISPDKKPFFSAGISSVAAEDKDYKLGARHYNGLEKKKINVWALDTMTFLTNIGFNTLGCWSSPEICRLGMPYFKVIEFKKYNENKLVDIFGPEFEKMIEKTVTDACTNCADDPNLIGYFLGNDLNWFGDYSFYMGHASYLFDMYFDLDRWTAGKKRVIEFLKNRYSSLDEFNNSWNLKITNFNDLAGMRMSQFNSKDINEIRNEFLIIVAEKYYSLMTEKVRSIDKNHLIFSDRFANSVPEQVLKISGKYCDAISLNYYKNLPDIDRGYLEAIYEIVKKPVLISEFTFRSMDNTSELRNTIGPDTTVASQEDRGVHFKRYSMSFAGLPFIIGYHWFQFYDDPQDGRASDDEDNNYGIVDQAGRPYVKLINAMREANPDALETHLKSPLKIEAKNIFLSPRIKVRNGEKDSAFSPIYLDAKSMRNIFTIPWGDTENNGKMTIQKRFGSLLLWFFTGYGWGCGASIFPPTHESAGYYNALGYKGIKFRMSIPNKMRIFIYLNESGVGPPWQKSYPGANGADGESYSSDEAYGTGKMEDYYYYFDSFNIRPVWGNQSGNKTIDLQAINDLEIAIPGRQGAGTIIIEKIELY